VTWKQGHLSKLTGNNEKFSNVKNRRKTSGVKKKKKERSSTKRKKMKREEEILYKNEGNR